MTGEDVSASQLREIEGSHNMLTDYKPGAYDEFYGGASLSSYAKLVAISTGPYMFVDFVTDGSDTRTGFTISLNLRPTSM